MKMAQPDRSRWRFRNTKRARRFPFLLRWTSTIGAASLVVVATVLLLLARPGFRESPRPSPSPPTPASPVTFMQRQFDRTAEHLRLVQEELRRIGPGPQMVGVDAARREAAATDASLEDTRDAANEAIDSVRADGPSTTEWLAVLAAMVTALAALVTARAGLRQARNEAAARPARKRR